MSLTRANPRVEDERDRAPRFLWGRRAPTRLRPELTWEGALKLSAGAGPIRRGAVDCWPGRDLLFGALAIDEHAFRGRCRGMATALRAATDAGYRELFECIEGAGYPHLLRMWNYLPRINAIEDGLERYRQFNIGRQEAFVAAGRSLTGALPAACALGSRDGDLRIGFLAARRPPRSLENPRQVSAFRYPPDYGPRSPIFARAVISEPAGGPLLFISGTAAIVGHRSLHPGDVVAQTRETIVNLEAMIEAANGALGRPLFRREDLDYVVYLRSGEDLHPVAAELSGWLGGGARLLLMEADICRRELLVEIEASSSVSASAAAPTMAGGSPP